VGSRKQPEEPLSGETGIRSAELLAVIGYAVDLSLDDCRYHSWRTALVAEKLAAKAAPDIRRDTFYAGLLHDIGAVGSRKHITEFASVREQVEDPVAKLHTHRGAALLDWLPKMDAVADSVRWHHERWDGSGYPVGKTGAETPLGSRILGLVDVVETSGAFASIPNLRHCMRSLAEFSGSLWDHDLWTALIETMRDSEFYRRLADKKELSAMIAEKAAELPVSDDLDNDDGLARVFHLFAALVDARDPTTRGHSLRVARYAGVLAEHMGLSESEVLQAHRAGLVHDCGRLGIPSHIMNRAGRLNDKELAIVRRHAEMTIRALSSLPTAQGLVNLGQLAGHDHECFNGSGYPDRLLREDIPIVSRILSVVDAYDAMVSTGGYRLLSTKGAVVRLRQGAGTQFDPAVVESMIEAVERGELMAEAA